MMTHHAGETVLMILVGFVAALAAFAVISFLPDFGMSEKLTNDRMLVIFTGLLVLVGMIQFGTFALQAVRLRQTIQTIDRTAKIQLKAYVFVAESRIIDPDGPEPKAEINIKNFGLTPAHNIIFATTVRGFNPTDKIEFPPSPVDDYSSRFVLAPGHGGCKTMPLDTLLNPGTMASLRAKGGHILYAWGDIFYQDVFGGQRHTAFRMSIGGSRGWPTSNLLVVSPEGNRAE